MWDELKRAFQEADAFTVHLHMKSGHSFEVSLLPPDWDRDDVFRCENISADRRPLTVRMVDVIAIEIEEA